MSDVRLRGEVGERRRGHESRYVDQADSGPLMYGFVYCDPLYCAPYQSGPERRNRAERRDVYNSDTSARVDAIIAHLQAARAVECGRLEERIAMLTLQLNEHADEVIALRLNLGHAEAENARLRLLAAGAGAGECCE